MSKQDHSFDKVYEALNTAQREAVESIEGPVMVIAGPGTGKTQVLAARIAFILQKTDTPASSILALTFTEAAAATMRKRIVDMIGNEGNYVRIYTFHALCYGIIQENPEMFPLLASGSPLSNLETYLLVEETLEHLKLHELAPLRAKRHYVTSIASAISTLKREHCSPEQLKGIIIDLEKELDDAALAPGKRVLLEKKIQRYSEMYKVYTYYGELLIQRGRFDYDDMINTVIDALKAHEDLRQSYQERYLYFLVDEYQDTNNAQNMLLDTLSSFWGPQANVFVVGDPHQSIYRFQGASIENMLHFLDTYPATHIITLDTGYRCPQELYTSAHTLIGHNTLTQEHLQTRYPALYEAVQKPLVSSYHIDKPITLFHYPNQTTELFELAKKIGSLIADGVPAQEIAVLYRLNNDSTLIAQELLKRSIPFKIEGGESIFNKKIIIQLLDLLKTLYDVREVKEDIPLLRIFSYPWMAIDPTTIFRLARIAKKNDLTLAQLLDKKEEWRKEAYEQESLSEEEVQRCVDKTELLYVWSMKEQSMRFQEWFVYLLDVSGYLPWILSQENKHEMLEDLNAFFREIKNMTHHDPTFDLRRCIEMIELLEAFQIRVEPISIAHNDAHVVLTTSHKAKGREWEYVFVPGFTTSWDKRDHGRVSLVPEEVLAETPLDKKEELEDSRRLIYVMLTRAKKEIVFSNPEMLDVTGQNKVAQRSAFCSELPPEYMVQEKSHGVTLQEETEILTSTLRKGPEVSLTVNTFEEYVHMRCKHMVINSTNFNRYIASPLEFILFDVLQVPRALTTAQIVGSAIHSVIEKWYSPLPTTLARKVTGAYDYLLEQGVGQQEASRWKDDMQKMLERFELFAKVVARTPISTEVLLGSKHTPLRLGKVPLSGRLDRIDDLDEKTLQVIDYKTSRDKSENEIRALRQSDLDPTEKQFTQIKGPLYRQLLFYKLLLDLNPTVTKKVESGAFWFLGPSATAAPKPRVLSLPDEHVKELKEHIQLMYRSIQDPAFIRTIPWELEALQFSSHGLGK